MCRQKSKRHLGLCTALTFSLRQSAAAQMPLVTVTFTPQDPRSHRWCLPLFILADSAVYSDRNFRPRAVASCRQPSQLSQLSATTQSGSLAVEWCFLPPWISSSGHNLPDATPASAGCVVCDVKSGGETVVRNRNWISSRQKSRVIETFIQEVVTQSNWWLVAGDGWW